MADKLDVYRIIYGNAQANSTVIISIKDGNDAGYGFRFTDDQLDCMIKIMNIHRQEVCMPVQTIYLVPWKRTEVLERSALLEAAGFLVAAGAAGGPALLKRLEAAPPDAVVIDLTRLPSQGRDLAVAIRTRKGTRTIPLVFLGGDRGSACERRGGDVVVPNTVFAAYAGKPLADRVAGL